MIYLFIFFFVGNLLFASSSSDQKDFVADIPVNDMQNKMTGTVSKKNATKNSSFTKPMWGPVLETNLKGPAQIPNLKTPNLNTKPKTVNPPNANNPNLPVKPMPLPVVIPPKNLIVSPKTLTNSSQYIKNLDFFPYRGILHQFFDLDSSIVNINDLTKEMISEKKIQDPKQELIRQHVKDKISLKLEKIAQDIKDGKLAIEKPKTPCTKNPRRLRFLLSANQSQQPYYELMCAIFLNPTAIPLNKISMGFHIYDIVMSQFLEKFLDHLKTIVFHNSLNAISKEQNSVIQNKNRILVQFGPDINNNLNFSQSVQNQIFPNNIGLSSAFIDQMKLIFESELETIFSMERNAFYFLDINTKTGPATSATNYYKYIFLSFKYVKKDLFVDFSNIIKY